MRKDDNREIYSITEINRLANASLNRIQLWVEGEVFQVKYKEFVWRYVYFYLKDPKTEYQIRCVVDPKEINALDFKFEEGISVVAYGQLGIYEKAGEYQLKISRIEQPGVGELLKKLKELKGKLLKEGLFAPEHKISIPDYPVNIGIITSAIGAAWPDFKKNSADKFPFLQLTLKDVTVQGIAAEKEIVNALQQMDRQGFDVLVLTRGGGSKDDLMVFNSEIVARTIYQCQTPIIAAVGHEIDTTIADLTADLRVSTPTAAAETVVRNYYSFFDRTNQLYQSLSANFIRLIESHFEDIDRLLSRLVQIGRIYDTLAERLKNSGLRTLSLFGQLIRNQHNILDQSGISLKSKSDLLVEKSNQNIATQYRLIYQTFKDKFIDYDSRLTSTEEKLRILSPLATLNRGYSIVTDKQGKSIRDSASVELTDQIKVQLAKGRLVTTVIDKEI